jgi:ABC-2 type transport system permease protein
VLGAVVVIALFGQILRLSGWVTGISPFSHVPKLPGVAVTVLSTGAPLFWLSLAALLLAAAGLAGLRRRDIG